jgi:hypothetical protein
MERWKGMSKSNKKFKAKCVTTKRVRSIIYFLAASAKLNSMASLRSLSSWLSFAVDRYCRSALLEVKDAGGDTGVVAVSLFGDVVPGLGGVFKGIFHALWGLPFDHRGLTGVVIPRMPLPRDETLSLIAGNSFSSERSEPVETDCAIPGDPGDPVPPADQASTFARGEVWTFAFDEDGMG